MTPVFSRLHMTIGLLAAFAALLSGCSSASSESSTLAVIDGSTPSATPSAPSDPSPVLGAETPDSSTIAPPTTAPLLAPTATATAEPTPTPDPRPSAPSGRAAPAVAATAAGLAAQVAQAEQGLRSPDATPAELADWGHLHQVAIRKLGYEPTWDVEFFEALPPEFHARTLLHVAARRALIDLSSGYSAADFIPAWEIIEPEPAEALLSYYREAEAATGIDWEYLAAINLIETGIGRIDGLSSAGAQGPMQFLPTTWAESGIGAGDITNPRDAINAAARYLVRRGGPSDMAGALWGYNNSDNYVTAVQAYAEILRQDPDAYAGIYNWEIYFYTEAGDIWLPVGFRTEERLDLTDFLIQNPWSAPDPGLR